MLYWDKSFRSWPTLVLRWRDWYRRVSASENNIWTDLGISHCIKLSLANMQKNEPLLSAVSYFWHDTFNAFIFGHGPMTPTLLDVILLTDLNVTASLHLPDLDLVPSHRFETKNVGGEKIISRKIRVKAWFPTGNTLHF